MNDSEPGWYVRSRGRVLGPFQFPQLEVLKNQGRLAKFDEVSRDRRTWVRASSLPDLFTPPAPPPETVAAGPETGSAVTLESVYPLSSGPHAAAPAAEREPGWFYMMGDREQTGPVGLSELIRLTQSGVVQAETFVWHPDLNNWAPARAVPALGLATATPPSGATATAPTSPGAGPNAFAVAGFILGLLGLLASAMAFLTVFFVSGTVRNREILAMIFLGLVGVWGISSLLAVILSPIGMVRANRSGVERRGFGLGVTGMVLGIVGLVGILILMFLAALGMVASTGAARSF